MKLKSMSPNLMVENVSESINFYQQYLGFEAVMTVPETGQLDWAMLKKGDVVLMFQKMQSFLGEYPTAQPSVGGSFSLYIDMEGVEAFYQTVESENFVLKKLHTTSYGKKEFSIRDNNGYILTFSEDASH